MFQIITKRIERRDRRKALAADVQRVLIDASSMTMAALLKAIPGVDRHALKRCLHRLRAEGFVECEGRRAGASWQWTDHRSDIEATTFRKRVCQQAGSFSNTPPGH